MTTIIRGSDNFDTGRFASTAQTISSGGALTLAHGLGSTPFGVNAYLKCVASEQGYSIGDELIITPAMSGDDTTVNRGLSVVVDAANLTIRFGSSPNVFLQLNKTTGSRALFVNAKWNLHVRAWA